MIFWLISKLIKMSIYQRPLSPKWWRLGHPYRRNQYSTWIVQSTPPETKTVVKFFGHFFPRKICNTISNSSAVAIFFLVPQWHCYKHDQLYAETNMQFSGAKTTNDVQKAIRCWHNPLRLNYNSLKSHKTFKTHDS